VSGTLSATAPVPRTTKRATVLASLALSGANVAKLGLQFAIIPVLARLLGPSAYGLVALAMPFILLTNLLSDAGLGAGLARRVEVSPALESTVFWLSTALGGVLMLAIAALAGPAAALIRQPALAPVLMALSPILLIGGLVSTANARVVREQRFGVFAACDLLSNILAAAAALAAAVLGWGAWALVAQQLVLWTVKGAWTLTAAGLRVGFVFRPALARDLAGYGLHVVGSGVCDFVSKNVDNMLIGVLLGVAALGGYAMAYQVISMPGLIISSPLYLTLFTAVARTERPEVGAVVLSWLRLLALVVVPVFAGLALTADLAVTILLGAKWAASGPMIALLCPAGLLVCCYSFVSAVMMGRGRADLQFRLALLNGAAIASAVLAGQLLGVRGVAGGVSLALLLILPVYLRALRRQTDLGVVSFARAFRLPVASTIVMALAVVVVRSAAAPLPASAQLALAIVAGALAYGATAATLGRRELAPLLAQARARFSRAEATP
jgi:PST family polysaccharide transporter